MYKNIKDEGGYIWLDLTKKRKKKDELKLAFADWAQG